MSGETSDAFKVKRSPASARPKASTRTSTVTAWPFTAMVPAKVSGFSGAGAARSIEMFSALTASLPAASRKLMAPPSIRIDPTRISGGATDFGEAALPCPPAAEPVGACAPPISQFGRPATLASSQIFGSLIVIDSMITAPSINAKASMLMSRAPIVTILSAAAPGALARRTSPTTTWTGGNRLNSISPAITRSRPVASRAAVAIRSLTKAVLAMIGTAAITAIARTATTPTIQKKIFMTSILPSIRRLMFAAFPMWPPWADVTSMLSTHGQLICQYATTP